MPTQVEKLRKFQWWGGGLTSTPWNGNSKGVGGGGGGGEKTNRPCGGGGIFSATTYYVFWGKECMKRLFTRPMARVRKPESGSISDW